MICIAGNKPVLDVAGYQVTDYPTEWILRSIERAAIRAGFDDFPFSEDIHQGIVHYLENKCPLRMLKLEKLYDRIRHTLKRIGFPTIADEITHSAPPVTVSLTEAAERAENGYELVFYNLLKEELQRLKQAGVHEVIFCCIREAILILRQNSTWSSECDQLEADIMLWLRKEGTNPTPTANRRIRCKLFATTHTQ